MANSSLEVSFFYDKLKRVASNGKNNPSSVAGAQLAVFGILRARQLLCFIGVWAFWY